MDNQVMLLDTRWLEKEELFGFWYGKMPPERREKIDAFRQEKDRRLSLGAGILLYMALRQAGADPAHVRLGKGPWGKPFPEGLEHIHFNLSHAGQVAACAVSGRPVGIDVEEERHFEEDLARFVFLDSEIDWIRKNAAGEEKGTGPRADGDSPAGQGRRKTAWEDAAFTSLWTIKESLIKYLGTGLRLEPKEICIDLNPPVSAVWPGRLPGRLFFTRYEVKGYQLTVCSEEEIFSGKPRWVIPRVPETRE